MGLQLTGTADDIKALTDRLSKCSGLTVTADGSGNVTTAGGPPGPEQQPFADALKELISDKNGLKVKVGRGQAKVVIDSFCKREIDLDDVEKFPESAPADSPSACTRCEVLIHVIAEYGHALKAGKTECTDGYDEAHKSGIAAQNQVRKANKQEGDKHGNVFVPPDKGKTTFCNGSSTIVTLDGDKIIKVEFEEPKKKEEEKPKEVEPPKMPGIEKMKQLYSTSDVVFSGTIEEVGEPPQHWTAFYRSHQLVTYGIFSVLKGPDLGSRESIHHLVLERSRSARQDTPGLSPGLFSPGRNLLVFASIRKDALQKGHFLLECVDGNLGALECAPEIVDLLRAAIVPAGADPAPPSPIPNPDGGPLAASVSGPSPTPTVPATPDALVGDLRITITGGAAGQSLTANIQVTLNAPISGDTAQLIDEGAGALVRATRTNPNTYLFSAVAIAHSGAERRTVLRITNIRVNTAALGAGASVIAFVSSGQLPPFTKPQQILAQVN